jgi:drug/metabolite transporter (DMT)-like permease
LTRKNLVSGLAWVMVTIACWAPLFSVAKRTLPYLDAFALGTVRWVIGALVFVLLLIAVEGRQALRYDGRFVSAAAFGLIGIAGFSLFVMIGLMFTLPEHASIISALQTPLTALVVWMVRGQRPAAFTLACVAVAIFGVLLVVTKGDPMAAIADLLRGGALLGDALVFLSAISWVIYTLGVTYFSGWSTLRVTTLTCLPGLAGLLIANIVAVAAGWASVPDLQTIGAVSWQILYLALGTVVLGVLGFNNAARKLGPLNTMLMLNALPVLVFGIEAALGRSFAAVELIGAAIVIAALIANNLYLRGVSTRR